MSPDFQKANEGLLKGLSGIINLMKLVLLNRKQILSDIVQIFDDYGYKIVKK